MYVKIAKMNAADQEELDRRSAFHHNSSFYNNTEFSAQQGLIREFRLFSAFVADLIPDTTTRSIVISEFEVATTFALTKLCSIPPNNGQFTNMISDFVD